jgi:hypothetical protein
MWRDAPNEPTMITVVRLLLGFWLFISGGPAFAENYPVKPSRRVSAAHPPPNGFDHMATRGDVSRNRFVQLYLASNRILAVAAINSAREIRSAKRLMTSSKLTMPERLADQAIDLGQLV